LFDLWNTLTYNIKFSAIAFVLSVVFGLFSMGFLGLGLYYTVFFLFRSYPPLSEWHGDWVWPALILVGMMWSLGFVIAGIAWHYLSNSIQSTLLLKIIYGIILWIWAAFLWYLALKMNTIPN